MARSSWLTAPSGNNMENQDLQTKRHSCAHVMAQAVQQLFPGTKLGIGPAIENGFYYDFDCPHAFTPEDLKTIEELAREEKVVAIGEIGLDYHYDYDKKSQKELFVKQLEEKRQAYYAQISKRIGPAGLDEYSVEKNEKKVCGASSH